MSIRGIAAAPGYAVGPIWRYMGAGLAEPLAGEPAVDKLTISDAASIAAEELVELADRVRAGGRASEAGILEAQALMATDELIVDEAERMAAQSGSSTPADLARVVQLAGQAAAATLAALDDELLSARAADVRDVAARIARILSGHRITPPSEPSIAVADDLPPSVTLELPEGSLIGVVLQEGSRTSHAAILSRALGIPAIVAAPGILSAVAKLAASGGRVRAAIDGTTGEVFLDPSADVEADLAERKHRSETEAQAAQALRGAQGQTASGHRIPLVANIGNPGESARALGAGAEGVGLFRTEFVFMGRQDPPTELEQVAAYREVLTAFGAERPVVIRLADIGGDKAIPYLNLPAEENPFLGVRGFRLAYGPGRDLVATQIRAIFRAGAEAGVTPHIMAPMVATVEDVELLVSLRDEVAARLDADGIPRSSRLVTGIMVEVPSAALLAPSLARQVDFFSIGTNDLTQYVLAADRTNGRLGALQDALHPAVLRAIAATVAGGDEVGIPTAVCGELASDPAGALVLAGLGVDELSMDSAALDAVRLALRLATDEELDELGRAALASHTAGESRGRAEALLASLGERRERVLAT
jgi:phosphoenolpyruvate-protein phosphotransferase